LSHFWQRLQTLFIPRELKYPIIIVEEETKTCAFYRTDITGNTSMFFGLVTAEDVYNYTFKECWDYSGDTLIIHRDDRKDRLFIKKANQTDEQNMARLNNLLFE
jgi:hypothetical protein